MAMALSCKKLFQEYFSSNYDNCSKKLLYANAINTVSLLSFIK